MNRDRALEHARMAESYEHDPRGAAIEFRKHLGWYVKGIPHSADLRRQLHAVESLSQVENIFGVYLDAVRTGSIEVAAATLDAPEAREPALT